MEVVIERLCREVSKLGGKREPAEEETLVAARSEWLLPEARTESILNDWESGLFTSDSLSSKTLSGLGGSR